MNARDHCLKGCSPPPLQSGTTLAEGRFLRNLKPSELQRRFPKDGQDPPEYGWKVKLQSWGWQGGLSVNYSECIPSTCCSLLLHPNSHEYSHVAVLDISRLAEALDCELLAMFKPCTLDADGYDNPCHFELVPNDISLQDLRIKVKAFFRDTFPDNRLPNSEEEKNMARACQQRFQSVVSIYVHPCDGT